MLSPEQTVRLRTAFPDIQESAPLSRFSTYRIGGPAAFLFEATNTDKLVRAVQFCHSEQIPFAVLGNGANTLISDKGFTGLVVIVKTSDLTFQPPHALADAGVKLSVLLVLASANGLGGLEVLAGVPGTVGGAVFGNAGAKEQAIGNFVESVEAINPTGHIVTLSGVDCEFDYRTSVFKRNGHIITRVRLRLVPGDPKTIQRAYQTVIQQKSAKQPTSSQSAGCMFKNAAVSDDGRLPDELRAQIQDGHLAAWRLIAAAGLQGKKIGGIQISTLHANFFVNDGTGRAEDILILMSYVKQQVRDRFGIQLHEEVRYLGFDAQ